MSRVRPGRASVRDGCFAAVSPETLESVELMVSELATNCIRHTDSGFELTVIRTGGDIRVEASDRAGGTPTMRSPEPTEPSGRGLKIIDMLSERSGACALTARKARPCGSSIADTASAPAQHASPAYVSSAGFARLPGLRSARVRVRRTASPTPGRGENDRGLEALWGHGSSPATILLVEDHRTTRTFLADNLSADGYRRDRSGDGVSDARRHPPGAFPDLAIVDLGLPDGDGLELLAQVRDADRIAGRLDPDLPLLVLSGRVSELDQFAGSTEGATTT